jgi:hypothetical protein
VVTLDLRPILIETADRVGLGDRVADRIPEDAGQVVVLQVDELDTAQNVFQLLKTLAWVLPILTLLVFGLAVWLSGDRRRAARNVGAVIAAVGLVGLVAARLGGNYLVDALTSEPEGDAAGNAAWDILTDLLRHSFRTMVIVGILFMVAAWLAGPRSSASGARRALAPALRNRIWPYLALAVAGLALLYSSEVLDASRLIVVAVLVTLGAVWIEVLRKQSLDEAPNG